MGTSEQLHAGDLEGTLGKADYNKDGWVFTSTSWIRTWEEQGERS